MLQLQQKDLAAAAQLRCVAHGGIGPQLRKALLNAVELVVAQHGAEKAAMALPVLPGLSAGLHGLCRLVPVQRLEGLLECSGGVPCAALREHAAQKRQRQQHGQNAAAKPAQLHARSSFRTR